MSLRSSAKTISAMVGNDMLDRADALVTELRIKPRWANDARQEAVLAELEGRDPRKAVRRFVRDVRSCGMTGQNVGKPDVMSFNDPALEQETASTDAETILLRREEQLRREQLAGEIHARLTTREQEIVRLRAMGWTQVEIAKHLGLTQQAISKIQQKIVAKSAA